MSAPRQERLNDAFREVTGENLHDQESITAARDLIRNSPRVEERLQRRGLTYRELDDHMVDIQKGWFSTYMFSTPSDWGGGILGWGGAALGTVGKLLTLKPVEGIVTPLTGSPTVGKIARWGAVAASLYFLTPYLFGLWSRAEGDAAGVGIDWLNQRNESLQVLGSGTPQVAPDLGSGPGLSGPGNMGPLPPAPSPGSNP